MQKMINLGRGTVTFAVSGPYPERFLNLCAEHNLAFWRLERVDARTLRVNVHWKQRKKLLELAERADFTASRVGQRGAPVFWRQLRRRLGLIVGVGLFFSLVFVMSQFVWDIEVVGNKTVSSDEILLNLQQLGVGIGTPVSRIDSDQLQDQMLLKLDKLSWLAVNVKGSRATVEVREQTPGVPMTDKSTPCHLIARKPGVIVSMSILEGQKKTQVGATVNTGDILAGGAIESKNGTLRMVHAMGEVYARTWYELEGCAALKAGGKRYTGRSVSRVTLQLGSTVPGLTVGPSVKFKNYDKRRTETKLTLPPGVVFPLTTVREEYLEYVPEPYTVNLDAAKAALQKTLYAQLDVQSEKAEILKQTLTWHESGDVLFGKLTVECKEQIAVEQPFDPLTIPTPTATSPSTP